MEIITIMRKGTLTHKDSMGTEATIGVGEVQVMSAGTGVLHSEYNAGAETVELFQIWIEPKVRNITPRYDQKRFADLSEAQNKLVLLVSPDGREETLSINQDALIYFGFYETTDKVEYRIPQEKGVYVFVIDGEIVIDGQLLATRDALEVTLLQNITLEIQAGTKFLIFEVPTVVRYL